MALAQKDMVAGPDAMIVRAGFMIMAMHMVVPMAVIVRMPVAMPMRMQRMVVRHAVRLAHYRCKVA